MSYVKKSDKINDIPNNNVGSRNNIKKCAVLINPSENALIMSIVILLIFHMLPIL